MSLARARTLAAECREQIAEGRNPIEERRRAEVPTFGECADQFISMMEGQWRNHKHRAQWKTTLGTYAATLRHKTVADIDTDDVLNVLTPIWETRTETASRVRGRIERVLDFAKARGWRSGENPALWRGHLAHILPARKKLSRGHHAAMPYNEVPALFARLQTRDAMAARALQFLILTATRSGEVREAVWGEIDFDGKLWMIPGPRMKTGKPHRIPLSRPALDILSVLSRTRVSDLLFPGQKATRPMSNMAYAMLMRRLGLGHFTAHGFRSSFRDWAGDETTFPRELAEHALAHQVGSNVEIAYRRSDALEKRRKLMDAWAEFCTSAAVDRQNDSK